MMHIVLVFLLVPHSLLVHTEVERDTTGLETPMETCPRWFIPLVLFTLLLRHIWCNARDNTRELTMQSVLGQDLRNQSRARVEASSKINSCAVSSPLEILIGFHQFPTGMQRGGGKAHAVLGRVGSCSSVTYDSGGGVKGWMG